jgi:hypothetical protein
MNILTMTISSNTQILNGGQSSEECLEDPKYIIDWELQILQSYNLHGNWPPSNLLWETNITVGQFNMGHNSASIQCPLPFAFCPLPFALCPLPFAFCLLPFAFCPISLCPISS